MLTGQLQVAQATPCDMDVQEAMTASDHHAHMQHGQMQHDQVQVNEPAETGATSDCCGSGDCPMTSCTQPTAAATGLCLPTSQIHSSERHHATSACVVRPASALFRPPILA